MSRKTATKTPERRPKRDVDGILLLDKPTGITSNRALQIAKRLYKARKAGHTGSLDPLASGMLPLCFGNATKVSGLLLESDKAYEVVMNIGSRTDTADADGEIVECSETENLSEEQLQASMSRFTGEYDQVPPMYSALKHDGQRLYKLAREGKEVERKARRICIHELKIVTFDESSPRLFVRCSKGTYIRSLVEDIARDAGTLAHVAELRRVWVEPFGASASMLSLQQLEELAEQGDEALDALLISADQALLHLPEVVFGAEARADLLNGRLGAPATAPGQTGSCRMYDGSGLFLGLGELQEGGLVAPKRIFAVNQAK